MLARENRITQVLIELDLFDFKVEFLLAQKIVHRPFRANPVAIDLLGFCDGNAAHQFIFEPFGRTIF